MMITPSSRRLAPWGTQTPRQIGEDRAQLCDEAHQFTAAAKLLIQRLRASESKTLFEVRQDRSGESSTCSVGVCGCVCVWGGWGGGCVCVFRRGSETQLATRKP